MPPRDQPESRAWRHGHQRREKDSALVAAVPTVVPPVADVAAPAADVAARAADVAAPAADVAAPAADVAAPVPDVAAADAAWRRRFPTWRRRFPTWQRRFPTWRRRSRVAAPVPDVAAPIPNLVAPTSDIIAFLQDMLTAAASAVVPLTQLQCDLLSWFSSFLSIMERSRWRSDWAAPPVLGCGGRGCLGGVPIAARPGSHRYPGRAVGRQRNHGCNAWGSRHPLSAQRPRQFVRHRCPGWRLHPIAPVRRVCSRSSGCLRTPDTRFTDGAGRCRSARQP